MVDKEYETIVETVDRPTLVLAGPGAGKTYILGDRTMRLLLAGTSKENITLLTFGKDACHNMRNKLLDPHNGFGIPYDKLPHISTLHSIGFEIVNKNPHSVRLNKTNLQVQTNENVKRLLFRDAALILDLNENQANAAMLYKQNGDLENEKNETNQLICNKYWEIMSKCNYIDFDDQVNFAVQILQTDDSILKEYQSKCKYLLVDEYQDINASQFKLINLLSAQFGNGLFAVGDDAQSIYGFRGSDTKYVLNFNKDYNNAFTPPLAHSRRCHKLIMEDAARMLKIYYPEWTGPHDLQYHMPNGEEPFLLQMPSDRAEAEWTARIAHKAVSEKKSVLILAPKKEFFPSISYALRHYSVPHACPVNLLNDNLNEKLSRVADLLKWLDNPEDSFLTRLVIESLMNYGQTKIPGADKSKRCSTQTIERRIEIEKEVAKLWEATSKKNTLFTVLMNQSQLSIEMEAIRDKLDQLKTLYKETGKKFYGEFAKELSLVIGNWAESQKLASDFASIINQIETGNVMGFGSVQLMTMRKAKGLEADVVIIVGLEDDIMPNPSSDIKEEARLFYVSMTRAKEKLYLIHSYKRLRSISFGPEITDKRRSRFLDSIGRKSKYLK